MLHENAMMPNKTLNSSGLEKINTTATLTLLLSKSSFHLHTMLPRFDPIPQSNSKNTANFMTHSKYYDFSIAFVSDLSLASLYFSFSLWIPLRFFAFINFMSSFFFLLAALHSLIQNCRYHFFICSLIYLSLPHVVLRLSSSLSF